MNFDLSFILLLFINLFNKWEVLKFWIYFEDRTYIEFANLFYVEYKKEWIVISKFLAWGTGRVSCYYYNVEN